MKVGVVIGRFQPLHDGHKSIISKMVAETDKAFVLVGSANSTGTIRNPWTYARREAMILAEYPTVTCVPLNDYVYSDSQWLSILKDELDSIKQSTNSSVVTLYGHSKEDNQYLHWIKDSVNYVEVENKLNITATQIRTELGSAGSLPYSAQMDFYFYKAEKELFKNYPFTETLQFVCADAIVHVEGQVLLIKRKHAPGIDKWALPGGFKNANESFEECAARELLEETGLDISKYPTDKFIELFDARPDYGGIPRITAGVCFAISNTADCDAVIESVKAADDAAEVTWMTIEDAMDHADMFYDHRDILGKLVGRFANKASLTHKDFIYATV